MVTRSGCASAARLKGRCPLISAKVGIGHTNSSHFSGGVNYLQPWAPIRTRGGGGNRHPLYDSTPAGATDARVGAPFESGPSENHSRNFAGTGALPAPLRSDHRRGRRMPAGRPQSRVSAAAQRQRDEASVVTLLHADQDCPFALCPRSRDDLAHVCRR